jgi:hypothetical protein
VPLFICGLNLATLNSALVVAHSRSASSSSFFSFELSETAFEGGGGMQQGGGCVCDAITALYSSCSSSIPPIKSTAKNAIDRDRYKRINAIAFSLPHPSFPFFLEINVSVIVEVQLKSIDREEVSTD